MTLKKLTINRNQKGFTLIELMIVIAIIGILAAIAIPNFIAYRNKSYCSAAESDANGIAAAIADYFSIPSRTEQPVLAELNNGNGYTLSRSGTANANTAEILDGDGEPNNGITISVTDGSGRCPQDYRDASGGAWAGLNFYKNMQP